jgi:hypothetical protein
VRVVMVTHSLPQRRLVRPGLRRQRQRRGAGCPGDGRGDGRRRESTVWVDCGARVGRRRGRSDRLRHGRARRRGAGVAVVCAARGRRSAPSLPAATAARGAFRLARARRGVALAVALVVALAAAVAAA